MIVENAFGKLLENLLHIKTKVLQSFTQAPYEKKVNAVPFWISGRRKSR